MMPRWILLFTALWALPILAQAQDFVTALAQLKKNPIVRAHFEQQKAIANMEKPLISSGSLLFSREQGVLWRMEKPLKAELIVTRHKLVQKTERTQSTLNLAGSPYGPATNVLLQLMSGNEDSLAQSFQLNTFEQLPQSWRASLTPKHDDIRKLFKRIDVEGDAYLNRLVMISDNDQTTTILFSDHRADTTVTASENGLFELAH